jgi:RHS repeat-associated protein
VLLSVSLNLEAPSYSSSDVTNSVVIQYTNTGTTEAPAPLLVLSADNANLWLPNDPAARGSSLQLLATNPDPNAPAGTLAPGASGSIVVDFASTDSTAIQTTHFSLGQLTSGQTIDWSSLESSMRPSFITPTAWNAVFANFTASVGSTTDSYQAALDADATYLAQLGEPTNDVAGLVVYEINKADNAFGTAPMGGTVDISVPTPGPDLSFARSFQSTISGRDQSGLFGLGWVSNWDISTSTDSQGNITINTGGDLRYFAKQSDGSYLPVLGDTGTLTALSGGGYKLTELDGSLTAFNANGTLNYIQDSNGNRITAGYNSSGKMVGLTEADGDALSISYNSQGFVSKIADPSGETANYTYDSAGHLLSVTTPEGTTSYGYITGTGTGADNALQTILNPDATQINYTYDSEGRLSSSFYGTAANPIEPATVGYLSPGGVTYTDANGNKTTVLYTDLDQPAVITDPLGNTTKLSYDASGDLTNAVLPGGKTYSYTYDLKGDLLSETNGLGNTTNFTYDAKGNLTSYTDAKGNTTSYAYDSGNDLLSVTYANGAKQSYTYNPLGEATQFLNARGQAIGYTYNKQGQITKETFADGTSYSYAYDAHGNLTSAADAQGRVTKFIYGGDPNNPNNPYLLTEVEYPDGTYLKFSYYAGGDRKQSVDQAGFTVNYTYDAAGNLTELTDGKGTLIAKYTYDAACNLIQQDNGNGTRTVYTYDAAGDVRSITNLAPDHTTVNSFDKYTYDALGNVLTDTNQDGQWVYTYDAESQLIKAAFTSNSTNPDKLTAQNIEYAYDAAGNRTSETVNGVTTTYAVNNVNEYTSSTTNGATTTYQYDPDGNLIAQKTGGSTTNYTFNELSQLTGVSGQGLTASYVYDPLGNRVSQTVNGATTNFQIDPAGNIAAAFTGAGAYNNSGGLLAHYTYGMGLVSQVSASGAAGYYDFGLTGNTIGITNAAGSYVNKYSYLPFGETTTITAALPNPFTFVGQFGVVQDTSNLFAMGAREYGIRTGQFLSVDPWGLAGRDVNFRRYGYSNPVNFVDPMGTAPYKGIQRVGDNEFWYDSPASIYFYNNQWIAVWDNYFIPYPAGTAVESPMLEMYQVVQKPSTDPATWVTYNFPAETKFKGSFQTPPKSVIDALKGAKRPTAAAKRKSTTRHVKKTKSKLSYMNSVVAEYIAALAVPMATVTTNSRPSSDQNPVPSSPLVNGNVAIGLAPDANGNLKYSGLVDVVRTANAANAITAADILAQVVSDDADPWDDDDPSDDLSGIEVSNVHVAALLGGLFGVFADLLFPANTPPGNYEMATPIGETGSNVTTWGLSVFSYQPKQPQYTSIAYGGVIQADSNQPIDPPLVVIDTTDPSITSASQVSVTPEAPWELNAAIPLPLVTGVTLSKLPGGMTQIVVNGVVSAVIPGAGPVVASMLDVKLGNEPTLRAEILVNQTSSAYTVNPETVQVAQGQPVQGVQVATVAGPANGSYSAAINWGDGDVSTGQLAALGGGLFRVTGSKPHPYATSGTGTITVTVNGPGDTPAPPAQTTVTVVAPSLPVILSNPTNQTVTAGQTATFTASASGAQSMQWQVSSDGGQTFSNISGATSTTLTLSNVQASQNGDEYRAVFTNSEGSLPTTAATLNVQSAATTSEIGVFSNGIWYLDSNGNGAWDGSPTDTLATFGFPGALPVVGDWGPNGSTDIGVYYNGSWYLNTDGTGVWKGNGNGNVEYNFGFAGAIPVVGNWGSNGATDIGVYYNGIWYLNTDGTGVWKGNGNGNVEYNFGFAGATPVVGNWGPNGATDIGVYANGNWYLNTDGTGVWKGNGNGNVEYNFGFAGAIPVVGNWGPSGAADIGVYANGNWYLNTDGTGVWKGNGNGNVEYDFGFFGAVPVVGDWQLS